VRLAIVTFDGFNELDSLIALGILGRAGRGEWDVSIASPAAMVTSMNGVTLHSQATLADACAADAVIVGSGVRTREIVSDASVMNALQFDASKQLIASQCSGALVLAELGLLADVPACTDLTTKPWLIDAGVEVLDQPFVAAGNVATAGGCLSAQYLAAWVIARLVGLDAAATAMHYVAPVGEKDEYVARALGNIRPYLTAPPAKLSSGSSWDV
jgi:transcriptional regulator GlxA family with amidase domain